MDIKEARKILDINMTLAIVKCLSEQLHGMQWEYSHQLKQKFNRLLKVARIYEKEIDKSMKLANDSSIEDIYDTLMDIICDAKELAIEKHKKENSI
jgi:hypothetical protein